jgi:hypothetical protein
MIGLADRCNGHEHLLARFLPTPFGRRNPHDPNGRPLALAVTGPRLLLAGQPRGAARWPCRPREPRSRPGTRPPVPTSCLLESCPFPRPQAEPRHPMNHRLPRRLQARKRTRNVRIAPQDPRRAV